MRTNEGWRGGVFKRSAGLALLCATVAAGQTTNSWNVGVNGFWDEIIRWSTGSRPSTNDTLVRIANATNKTVTIDNFTATNYPGSMIISNLWLSAPTGNDNILYLNNATARTFQVLNDCVLTNGGLLRLANSAMQVGSDMFMDGRVEVQAGGALTCTGGVLYAGYDATRSSGIPLVTIGPGGRLLCFDMTLGALSGAGGNLLVAGGTNTVLDDLRIGGGGILSPNSTVTMENGLLSADHVTIGSIGHGVLMVSNGTVLARQLDLGGTLSSGTMTLIGGTTAVSNTMRIGYTGNGSVTVNGGTLLVTNGTIQLGTGTGQMTVQSGLVQAATMYLSGASTRLALSGGMLTAISNLYVSGGAGVEVTGGRFLATNADFYVGYTTTPGRVVVNNGLVESRHVYVGFTNGASGTLGVAGGTNAISGNLELGKYGNTTGDVWVSGGRLSADYVTVGNAGRGALTVSNGTVLADHVDVGYGATSYGAMTLLGGTTLVSNTMRIGCSSTGEVTVAGGTLLATNGVILVGADAGRMTVQSGLVSAATMMVAGAEARLALSGGTLGVRSNLYVLGAGNVEITGGRFVATNADSYIGYAMTPGRMVVSNGLVEAENVYVGYTNGASGTLGVAGGTNAISGYLDLGTYNNTIGNVWVSGGLLTVTNKQTYVGDRGVGLMTVSGGTANLGTTVTVGNRGTSLGKLTVAGGVVALSSNLTVASFAGSTGEVLVTSGSLLAPTAEARIGSFGRGALTVSNGLASFSRIMLGVYDGGIGAMRVAGGTNLIGSQLQVASAGSSTGVVELTGGLLVVTNNVTEIGRYGHGEMTIRGGVFRARDVQVGAFGGSDGTLNISGGNSILSGDLQIGVLANATGAVSIAGGLLSNAERYFVVGDGGVGSLKVAGGTILTRQMEVGAASTGTGDMDVGDGTVLATNAAHTGQLIVRRGTFIQHGGLVWADRFWATNPAGTVTLRDGTLRVGYSSSVSNGSPFVIGDGTHDATLILGNGTHSFRDGLVVTNRGLLQSQGGTIDGSIVNESAVQIVSGSLVSLGGISGGGSGIVNPGAGWSLRGGATFGSLSNAGTVTVQSPVAISGPVTNGGSIFVGGSGMPGVLSLNGNGTPARGVIVVEPPGLLRLGADPACLITNRGAVQLSVGVLMLTSGLVNEANLNLSGGQALSIMSSIANPGAIFASGGSVLSVVQLERNTHSGSLFLGGGSQFAAQTSFTNTGAISLDQGSVGGAGTVLNAGLIEGRGAVSAPLVNRAGGTIRAAGGLLSLSGASFQNQAGAFLGATVDSTLRIDRHLANDGTINPQGGTIDFGAHTLTNRGTATGYGTYSAGLILNEGRAIFQGGTLNVQGFYLNTAGHTTEVRYASATFHGMATNAAGGVFKNTGGQVSFLGGLYNNGSYVSDPATNWFLDTLTLGDEGTLAGGEGDVFQVEGDLVSLNPEGLLLSGAALSFGLGEHDLVLAGETAVGWLSVADGGSLEIGGANLYIGGLDVELDQLVTAHTLFYDTGRNPALDGQTYALAGGGWAMPIPEPSSVLLLAMATAGLAWLRRRVRG